MMRTRVYFATMLTASVLMAAPAVLGQDPGAPPQGAPTQGAPPQGRGPQGPRGQDNGRGEMQHGDHPEGAGRPMGLLPPGTWWRSAHVVAAIGLAPDQQKRIDDIFLQTRVQLIDLHASLEKEQLLMEPLLAANPVDQGKALAQISKIADTRAELEKTDAKMLLSIRSVLSAEQWTKLQGMHGDQRGGERGGGQHAPDGLRGPRSGDGPGQFSQGAPHPAPAT